MATSRLAIFAVATAVKKARTTTKHPTPDMSRTLVVHDGKRERELSLVERLVVGRDPACDISHDDALLSRRHAEFVPAADRVTVRDLGSRNGIFVNGARTAERALEPDDVVQIGPLRVRYVVSRASAALTVDDVDIDATIVSRRPQPATGVSSLVTDSAPLPGRQGVSSNPDEEATRLFRPPPSPAHKAVEPTSSQAFSPLEIQPGQDAPASRVETTLDGFVFGRLTALAAIVCTSTAIPLILLRLSAENSGWSLLLWFGLSLAIAAAATYSIAIVINRRFSHVLTVTRQRRHSSVRGDIPSAGNSSVLHSN